MLRLVLVVFAYTFIESNGQNSHNTVDEHEEFQLSDPADAQILLHKFFKHRRTRELIHFDNNLDDLLESDDFINAKMTVPLIKNDLQPTPIVLPVRRLRHKNNDWRRKQQRIIHFHRQFLPLPFYFKKK